MKKSSALYIKKKKKKTTHVNKGDLNQLVNQFVLIHYYEFFIDEFMIWIFFLAQFMIRNIRLGA